MAKRKEIRTGAQVTLKPEALEKFCEDKPWAKDCLVQGTVERVGNSAYLAGGDRKNDYSYDKNLVTVRWHNNKETRYTHQPLTHHDIDDLVYVGPKRIRTDAYVPYVGTTRYD